MWRALILSIALAAMPAHGQTASAPAKHASDAELAFERAATAQAQARTRIGVSRGFTLEREPTVLLDALQAKLATPIAEGGFAPGTMLLLYSRQGEMLRSWLVSRDGLVAHGTVPIARDAVTDRIAAVRASLVVDTVRRARAPHRSVGQEEGDVAPGRPLVETLPDLEAALIAPAIGQALAAAQRLIVVPADDIALAPLALLHPVRGAGPLIDRLSITIAPSLQDAIRSVPAWDYRAATAKPLVVGDPDLPFTPGWVIPPLPGARAEAAEFAQTTGAALLSGDDASRDTVRMRAPEASLLYFATHGLADDSNPVDGSVLMFAGPTLDLGWLTARDIQSLRLTARLAVLSACQTGMGGTQPGGIIGLARAFQLAGVPRVAMSLWSVDDAATGHLMKRFARHLRTAAPADALRQAMLETRTRFRDPASWASFAMFGTPR